MNNTTKSDNSILIEFQKLIDNLIDHHLLGKDEASSLLEQLKNRSSFFKPPQTRSLYGSKPLKHIPLKILMYLQMDQLLSVIDKNITELQEKIDKSADLWNKKSLSSREARSAIEKAINDKKGLEKSKQVISELFSLKIFFLASNILELQNLLATQSHPDPKIQETLDDLFHQIKTEIHVLDFSIEELEKSQNLIENSELKEHFANYLLKLQSIKEWVLSTFPSLKDVPKAKKVSPSIKEALIEALFQFEEKLPLQEYSILELPPNSFDDSSSSFFPIFSSSVEENEQKENLSHNTSTSHSLTPPLPTPKDPWKTVGKILFDNKGKAIGVCGEPISSNEQVYISCYREEDISNSDIDQFSLEAPFLLKIRSTDIEERKVLLKSTVADNLGVPVELALFPTFIRELIETKGISSILPKVSLQTFSYKISYFPFDSLQSKDELAYITHAEPQFNISGFLAPQGEIDQAAVYSLIDRKIQLGSKNLFGKVHGFVKHPKSGYFVLFVKNHLSNTLIKTFIRYLPVDPTTNTKDIWWLRFLISKRLENVLEADALLPQNLFRFISGEKIPLLPWELELGYYGLAAFRSILKEPNSLTFKRKAVCHDISDLFPNNASIEDINGKKARTLGCTVEKNNLFYLVTQKSFSEILAALKRPTTTEYQEEMVSRISKAINCPPELATNPSIIAKYLMYFTGLFDQQSITEAKAWLIKLFSIKKIPVNAVQDISQFNDKNPLMHLGRSL
ncbi:MAG: hypothetical protein ACFFC7_00555 [Candidatus Hermodarchaeota archaeon]